MVRGGRDNWEKHAVNFRLEAGREQKRPTYAEPEEDVVGVLHLAAGVDGVGQRKRGLNRLASRLPAERTGEGAGVSVRRDEAAAAR